MNYFRRIVQNTIGSIQPSIRPVVNPESIPDSPLALGEEQVPPEVKASKNIDLASKTPIPFAPLAPIRNSKAPSDILPAANEPKTAVKGNSSSILPKESQDSDSLANPHSSSDSPLEESNRSIQPPPREEPLSKEQQQSVSLNNLDDSPLEESNRSIQPPPREEPLSKEQQSVSLNNLDDADATPAAGAVTERHVVKQMGLYEGSAAPREIDEARSEPPFLSEPQIYENKEKEKATVKISGVEPWPQRASIAPRQAATFFAGPKTDKLIQENKQEAYSNQLTTPLSKTKYSETANQSGETVVMINIGRIEVKTEIPAKPAPSYKFSPVLSLADYLKQRSEGKIG